VPATDGVPAILPALVISTQYFDNIDETNLDSVRNDLRYPGWTALRAGRRVGGMIKGGAIRVCEVSGPDVAARTEQWAADWRVRLEQWYGSYSRSSAWVQGQVQSRLSHAREVLVFDLIGDGASVGTLGLAPVAGGVTLFDLVVRPEHRGQGHGKAAVAWAKDWADARDESLSLAIDPADPVQRALVAGMPVRAQTMVKELSTSQELPDDVTARPMSEPEFVGWRALREREYADQMAGSGLLSPQDAAAQAKSQFDELLPDGVHSTGQSFTSLEVNSQLVATIWLGHHFAPDTTWVLSVDVEERHRGHGYGRAAMLWAEPAALSTADTQLGLNVFGPNAVAIKLYDGLGYRTVHQQRSFDIR
jgi:GNAT superfamily N-acetyltransferase